MHFTSGRSSFFCVLLYGIKKFFQIELERVVLVEVFLYFVGTGWKYENPEFFKFSFTVPFYFLQQKVF